MASVRTSTDGPGAVTRRAAVLGMGGVLLLSGCTAPSVRRGGTSSPRVTPTPSGSPSGPGTWDALRRSLRGRLIRPADAGYAVAAQLENARFDGAKPLGIVLVEGAADVAACLAFARRNAVPVAIRSGGHSYAGWSAGGAAGTDVPPSLVISTAALDSIRIDGDRVTVGPGARLVDVYAELAKRGRAIGGGTCATVAIGGLTLGGGMGVLGRSFGLTCDQLEGLTIVTAEGRERQVSAEREPDLYWAARGGGTGTLGVVTSLTFRTRAAPSVTRFVVPVPFGAAGPAIDAWQRFAPHADDRLWTSLHLTVKSGKAPSAELAGAWIGEHNALPAVLRPLRQHADGAFGDLDSVREDYGTAMLTEAGCAGIPVSACHTGSGGALKRAGESATSSVAYDPVPERGIAALVDRIEAGRGVRDMTEGAILLDALGGAIGRVAGDATAFPHRSALYTVQYTATYAPGVDSTPFDRYVSASRSAITPSMGNHAYANYVDPSIPDPGRAYFGANIDRLRTVLASVDPDRMFRQPHFVRD